MLAYVLLLSWFVHIFFQNTCFRRSIQSWYSKLKICTYRFVKCGVSLQNWSLISGMLLCDICLYKRLKQTIRQHDSQINETFQTEIWCFICVNTHHNYRFGMLIYQHTTIWSLFSTFLLCVFCCLLILNRKKT